MPLLAKKCKLYPTKADRDSLMKPLVALLLFVTGTSVWPGAVRGDDTKLLAEIDAAIHFHETSTGLTQNIQQWQDIRAAIVSETVSEDLMQSVMKGHANALPYHKYYNLWGGVYKRIREIYYNANLIGDINDAIQYHKATGLTANRNHWRKIRKAINKGRVSDALMASVAAAHATAQPTDKYYRLWSTTYNRVKGIYDTQTVPEPYAYSSWGPWKSLDLDVKYAVHDIPAVDEMAFDLQLSPMATGLSKGLSGVITYTGEVNEVMNPDRRPPYAEDPDPRITFQVELSKPTSAEAWVSYRSSCEEYDCSSGNRIINDFWSNIDLTKPSFDRDGLTGQFYGTSGNGHSHILGYINRPRIIGSYAAERQ